MLSVRGNEIPSYKIVLLGEQGTGKSCLVKRLQTCQTDPWRTCPIYKPTVIGNVHSHTSPGLCHLYIVDTSGRSETNEAATRNLYLQYLDCVVFVFALDEPETLEKLKQWNESFESEFKGDMTSIHKVVVGTKMDQMRHLHVRGSVSLQEEASSFAASINATFCVTSSLRALNVHDTFLKISQVLVSRPPCLGLTPRQGYENIISEADKAIVIGDELKSTASEVIFPDPVLVQHGEGMVTSFAMSNLEQGVILKVEKETGAEKQLLWKLSAKSSTSHEPELVPLRAEDSRGLSNALWTCLMSTDPVSVWQYEGLDSSAPVMTTVRRQPTHSHLRNIQHFLFCSSDKGVKDRAGGLYYMLLLNDNNKLLECGLTPALTGQGGSLPGLASLVKRNFILNPKPLYLPGKVNVVSYSLSPTHAAVVLSNGHALAWGHGQNGALGLEEHEAHIEHTFPVPMVNDLLRSQATQVACGLDFTLILTRDGEVFSCGSGAFGKLGHGNQENKLLPTKVENLWYVKAVSAGHHHAIALTSRCVIYSWGLQCPLDDTNLFPHQLTPKKLGGNDDLWVEQIASGAYHSLCVGSGLVYGGAAYTWGLGSNGQLGWGRYANMRHPRCVGELYNLKKVRVVSVSGGTKHSAFLTSKGDVFTCGNNEYGQLGYSTETANCRVPRKVELGINSSGVKIRAAAVTCVEDYTMVRTEEKDILIWGKCAYGRSLPDPFCIKKQDTVIVDVATVQVPCGNSFLELSLALTGDGKLMMCSVNISGVDHRAIEGCHEKLIPSSNRAKCFVRMTAAGSILVTVDRKGTARYASVESWIRAFIGNDSEFPVDIGNQISLLFKKKKANEIPEMDFRALNLPDAVCQVEATVDSFLLRTDIGDVFSWTPLSGQPPKRCDELNDKIVVQIACGGRHMAVLCDEGMLFTRGHGANGQLGFGNLEDRVQFEKVPLCQSVKIQSLFCGWGSTSALTTEGKVFFWGQLDISRDEKLQMKRYTRGSKPGLKINSTIDNKPPAPCQAMFDHQLIFDGPGQDGHNAVIGRSFQFQIVTKRRAGNSPSEDLVFRVEAWYADGEKLHVKGKSSKQRSGSYLGSITFLREGLYYVGVSTVSAGGSCFTVRVERGCQVRTCKLSLVGARADAVKCVEDTLKQELCSRQGSRASLKFPGRDLALELWGCPKTLVDPDGSIGEVVSLSCVTDEGAFVYVWEEQISPQFPEENFKLWLYHTACHASKADVVLLSITSNAERADEFVLAPFQEINPNFRRAIAVTPDYHTTPGHLINELREVVETKLKSLDPCNKIVSHTFETIAEKLRRMDDNSFLTRVQFERLANECGIHGQTLYQESVRYLERVGVCLAPQKEEVFVIARYSWFVHQLTEMVVSRPDGFVETENLDPVKKVLVDFLVDKGVASSVPGSTKIPVLPRLRTTGEELWSQSEAGMLSVFRHLLTKTPPHQLHTIFPKVSSEIARIYENVTIRKSAVIIHEDGFKARVDFGPCLIDRSITEFRVVVQSQSTEIARKAADDVVKVLQDGHAPKETSDLHVSCQKCFKSTITLEIAEDVAKASEQETITCPRCNHPSVAAQLLSGYQETRKLPDLLTPVVSGEENFGSVSVVRAITKHIDSSNKRLEKKILSESRVLFGKLAKFFMDIKTYDVPRTVFLAPDFQDCSHKLKGDIMRNLKHTLLTWQTQRFRLHLLCEGNGDGTGVHFLEGHKGYELAEVNEFIIKFINGLGFGIQMLISWLPIAQTAHNLSKEAGVGGLDGLFPSIEVVAGVLGFTGITKATLEQIKWKEYFKEMQGFLESFNKEIKGLQETAGAMAQPKPLSDELQTSHSYRLDGKEYEYLRNLLLRLDKNKTFGGLVQEAREDLGLVWVCKRHSRGGLTERVQIEHSHSI